MKTSKFNLATDRLYTELKAIIRENGKLTTSNIVTIVITLMQTVDSYGDVKGPEKKATVLHVLKRLINDTMNSDSDATAVTQLVDMTVPVLIDSLVSIDKKQIIIKTKKCLAKLFACCGK